VSGEDLAGMTRAELEAHLRANSGLPGPQWIVRENSRKVRLAKLL
jgi:hypothetical protein